MCVEGWLAGLLSVAVIESESFESFESIVEDEALSSSVSKL